MATQNTHTEAPGGKPAFPPFEKETFASQLVWLVITFVALYVLMAKVALPRVGGIIAARRGRIADDLAAAQRLKEDTDAAIAAHEKKLADARVDAQAIASETRDKLMTEANKRRALLANKLSERLVEAEKTIAATKSAAMANVRSIAAEAASSIVERLIGAAPSEKAVNDAVADVLKR